MADTKEAPLPTSSGVKELIERLREQGVQSGRDKAADIVNEAERQAEETVRKAQQKAEGIVNEARDEAERLRNAGEDALRVATRDTVLRFREELMGYLNERVRRLVCEQLEDKELLQRLILEVAAQASRDAGVEGEMEVELLLPTEILGIEELRQKPEELEGKLSELVKQISSAAWREGVTFKPLEKGALGIRVVLTEKDIEVDMSDKAIADMLLEHLQPRFRALMEGIIR
jgi:V/A-type H+-transporting ATPase subunit E